MKRRSDGGARKWEANLQLGGARVIFDLTELLASSTRATNLDGDVRGRDHDDQCRECDVVRLSARKRNDGNRLSAPQFPDGRKAGSARNSCTARDSAGAETR
eukprot:1737506-Pleurochrysis_carterae.AAC.2